MKPKKLNNENCKALHKISKDFDIVCSVESNFEDLFLALSNHINHLIQYDFNALLHILYRVDVSEEKLNIMLKENKSKQASDIITHLLIERELQKMAFRAKYSKNQ